LRFDEIFRVEQAHDLDRREIALSANDGSSGITESADTANTLAG